MIFFWILLGLVGVVSIALIFSMCKLSGKISREEELKKFRDNL